MAITNTELKAARTRLNLTAKKMAERLNTPFRTYQGWELGRKIPGIVEVTIAFIENETPVS